VAEFRSLVDVT